MESIILAVIRRDGVASVEDIIKKTGFNRVDVIRTLHILEMRGKITFMPDLKNTSVCGGCPLNKFCIRKERKNGTN